MANISCGLSFTINLSSNQLEFAKIDAHINDVDLEQDLDLQLGKFDEVMDKAFEMLKMKMRTKVKAVRDA